MEKFGLIEENEMMVVTAKRLENGSFEIDAWHQSADSRELGNTSIIKVEPDYVEIVAHGSTKEAELKGIYKCMKWLDGNSIRVEYTPEFRDAYNCLLRDVCEKAIYHIRKNHPDFEGWYILEEYMMEAYQNEFF